MGICVRLLYIFVVKAKSRYVELIDYLYFQETSTETF